MRNPVLAEVTRGGVVESVHEGSVAVLDADGAVVLALGDIDRPVFPRSAVKALQALPLLESGAADRFGLTAAEIALACSSHSGEPLHAQTAAGMLAKAGRDPGCLECGAHWPSNDEAARQLAREGLSATALHNNCSGKHSGFVCLSCALDEDPTGYIQPEHRVQREVKAAIEAMGDVRLSDELRGTDGCSIPTYAMPLRAMALAFARLGTGHGMGAERAKAARRIRASVAEHPFMVAGTRKFDTEAMTLFRRAAVLQDGRGRRLLRRPARTRLRHRAEMRRRAQPRGAGDAGGGREGAAAAQRSRGGADGIVHEPGADQLERHPCRRDPPGRRAGLS